jgi:predicted Holliday junction resolvase-like endonuclease
MLAYIKLIPYAAIVLLVLAVGWYKWSSDVAILERDKAKKELEIVQAVNAEQAKTIQAQNEWRETSSKLISDLSTKVLELTTEQQDKQTEVVEAGNADDEAKKWYATVIPANMQRVLNTKANRSKQN